MPIARLTHDLRRQLVILSSRHLVTWLALAGLGFALALLPLPIILLLAGAGLALLLPLLDPVFGLYLAVLSVPVQELVQLPGGFSVTQAAMLLAVYGWGLHVLAHPERPIATGRLFPFWVAFLYALLLAASFTPYSPIAAAKETLRWIEAFLVWLLAINAVRRHWHGIGLIVCLLLAPAAEALVGLAQFVSGSGPPSFRIAPDLPFVRAYGTIGQPNSFAGYLNMAWPLALALAVGSATLLLRQRAPTIDGRTENREQRTKTILIVACSLFFVLCSLMLAGLAASFSRGAWVGAAIGGLGMLLALGRQMRRWTIVALIVVALGLGLGGAGLLPASVGARLASVTRSMAIFDASAATITPDNFAVVERMAQLQAGWRMFLAYPLTGVGPGNYTLAYPAFAVGTWYASRGHAHNYYVHMAAEAGIAGVLAYLALLAAVSYQAIGTLRGANSTFWHSAAIGCCGIIAAVAGHDLFENLHALSMGIQLAAVWGLLTVLSRIGQPLPQRAADRSRPEA
jgi:O-antigen ligase